MLWDIRARMKPALSVIDMIPNVHRTATLALLRRVVLQGGVGRLRISQDDKVLAYFEGPVQLTSPIGANLLLALYREGKIKLKKPGPAQLPQLEAYAATEPEFRADVTRFEAVELEKRRRIDEITLDPSLAQPDEVTPDLINKLFNAKLGHAGYGEMTIGGLTCHRALHLPEPSPEDRIRPEPRVICRWIDASGQRQGDPI